MHYKSEAKRHASINELLGAVLLVPKNKERKKERKSTQFNVRLINKETNVIHARNMVELSNITIYSGDLYKHKTSSVSINI